MRLRVAARGDLILIYRRLMKTRAINSGGDVVAAQLVTQRRSSARRTFGFSS
jgi:hypothetical protein